MANKKFNENPASVAVICLLIAVCTIQLSLASDNFDKRINQDNVFSLATAEINGILNDSKVDRCLSLWKNLNRILQNEPETRQWTLADIQASKLNHLKIWLEAKLLRREQDEEQQKRGGILFDPWHVAYLSVSRCVYLVQLEHKNLLNQRVKPEEPIEIQIDVLDDRKKLQRSLSEMQEKLAVTEQKEKMFETKLEQLNESRTFEVGKLQHLQDEEDAGLGFQKTTENLDQQRVLKQKINSIDEQLRLVREKLREVSNYEKDSIMQQIDHLQSDRERAPLALQLANCRARLRKNHEQAHKRAAKMELELWKKRDSLKKCRKNLTKILSLNNNI